MRLQLAALGVLCALAVGAQAAAQELPVGVFHVVPPSGPIGTVVTVSGDFDREITLVSFWCLYSEPLDEGFNYLRTPVEPSPSFTFDYEIPSELLVWQGDYETISPLGGECYFRADAGHQHRSVRVPFTVTEDVVLPSTGQASQPHAAAGTMTAVILFAVGGLALLLLGWRYRQRA